MATVEETEAGRVHVHGIYDTDAHYIIDPITREIRAEHPLTRTIAKYDHNSEIITFELPKTVDGHDMLLSNRVWVHYINIDAQTRKENRGIYEAKDLQLSKTDENTAVFSWTITRNSTQLAGILSFSIRFACIDENGEESYGWGTANYDSIIVCDRNHNSEIIVEEYADILEQWRQELFAGTGNTQGGSSAGYSIYYMSMAVNYPVDGLVFHTASHSSLSNNGKGIKIGDMIISSNGVLCEVTNVSASSVGFNPIAKIGGNADNEPDLVIGLNVADTKIQDDSNIFARRLMRMSVNDVSIISGSVPAVAEKVRQGLPVRVLLRDIHFYAEDLWYQDIGEASHVMAFNRSDYPSENNTTLCVAFYLSDMGTSATAPSYVRFVFDIATGAAIEYRYNELALYYE